MWCLSIGLFVCLFPSKVFLLYTIFIRNILPQNSTGLGLGNMIEFVKIGFFWPSRGKSGFVEV